MIFYIFADLIQIYKVFYILVTEILERFPTLSLDQAKKTLIMYQNFLDFNNIMKSKAERIMIEFNFSMQLPTFYTPD